MHTAAELSSSPLDDLRDQGFHIYEHGVDPALFEEAYYLMTRLVSDYPMPPSDWIRHSYDPIKDEVGRYDSDDGLLEWNLYRTRAESLGKPVGLTDRRSENVALAGLSDQRRGAQDIKAYMHFTPAGRAAVEARHENNGWTMPPELIKMHEVAAIIHQAGVENFIGTLSLIEDELGSTFSEKLVGYFTPEDALASPLRFGGYYVSEEFRELLAGLHFDKGFGSVAMNETGPGLIVADPSNVKIGEDGKIIDGNIPMNEVIKLTTEAAVFFARQFQSFTEETGIKSAWHGAKLVEGSKPYNSTFQRLVTVLFPNSLKLGTARKVQTHDLPL